MGVRKAAKSLAGGAVSTVLPNCRFDHLLVIIGHMRTGSSVLSNVICEHPEISGFGEAHITYQGRAGLGILALSQLRRGVLKPRARHLFDKILHSRYDMHTDSGLFDAQAIFLARKPAETLPSILKLFVNAGSTEYATIEQYADYYENRLEDMLERWQRFDSERRMALTYDTLVADADGALERISQMLNVDAPLRNHYTARSAAMQKNAGDPVNAPKFNTITKIAPEKDHTSELLALGLSTSRLQQLDTLFIEHTETV